jgi:TM2 domain-containing membrane protein YozV
MYMLDAEKLKELKDKDIISEEELVAHKHRMAAKILRKEQPVSSRSGIIYIILAFFLGAVGIHNFYAGYWKRGLIQFFCSLISPYIMFLPLMFTAIWALMELLFVNKDAKGVFFRGNRKIILVLRLLSVLVLFWFASSPDMMVHDINFETIE